MYTTITTITIIMSLMFFSQITLVAERTVPSDSRLAAL